MKQIVVLVAVVILMCAGVWLFKQVLSEDEGQAIAGFQAVKGGSRLENIIGAHRFVRDEIRVIPSQYG